MIRRSSSFAPRKFDLSQCERRRSAFTIIEMLLVMSVIVMAAAIVVSNIDGVRQAYRLPRAADDLRGILAGLRARAMDEATMFEFSFEPDSSKFKVRKAGESADRSNAAPSEVDIDPSDRAEFDRDDVLGEHELSAGLKLVKNDRGDGVRSANAPGDEEQSQPMSLRFLPDGSCTGLAFILKDDAGGQVDIHVRALTGAVKMVRKTAQGKEIER